MELNLQLVDFYIGSNGLCKLLIPNARNKKQKCVCHPPETTMLEPVHLDYYCL